MTSAGWPSLLPATYYWVALSPTQPLDVRLPRGNGAFDGVVWSGLPYNGTGGLAGSLTAAVLGDPSVFTGRQLTSQRFAGDAAFAAPTAGVASWLTSAQNWSSVPSAQARLTNWNAANSNVRYGVQVIGLVVPNPSNTGACAEAAAWGVRACEAGGAPYRASFLPPLAPCSDPVHLRQPVSILHADAGPLGHEAALPHRNAHPNAHALCDCDADCHADHIL